MMVRLFLTEHSTSVPSGLNFRAVPRTTCLVDASMTFRQSVVPDYFDPAVAADFGRYLFPVYYISTGAIRMAFWGGYTF
jgi:hypothetical protein